MKILAIEPFYGGSHKEFIDGWINHSCHDWTLITLPAEFWHWRNRFSVIQLRDELNNLTADFDLIFASSMLNINNLKAYLPIELQTVPIVSLFHENQLHYPLRSKNGRRHIDAVLSDLSTGLLSTQVWWNSHYNYNSFLTEITDFLISMEGFDDPKLVESYIREIEEKSTIIKLGIDKISPKFHQEGKLVHIVWAARWEHDKNATDIFTALTKLKEQGVEFNLSVIGESLPNRPKCFDFAKEFFAENIINWGFLDSREEYFQALQSSDIFVSTSKHEFFGLSAVEAAAAGAVCILPRRLAYPEVFANNAQFYAGSVDSLLTELTAMLELLNKNPEGFVQLQQHSAEFAKRYFWEEVAQDLDRRLKTLFESTDHRK